MTPPQSVFADEVSEISTDLSVRLFLLREIIEEIAPKMTLAQRIKVREAVIGLRDVYTSCRKIYTHFSGLEIADQLSDLMHEVSRLRKLAVTDEKTNLLAWRGLKQGFAEWFLAATGSNENERSGLAALWLLDIQDFKKINELLTYPGADVVLRRVADLIREHIREHTRDHSDRVRQPISWAEGDL